MHSSCHRKPDGRELWLYGRKPIQLASSRVPMPLGDAAVPDVHLRWHPIIGEWVIYAAHRQARTFLPSAAENPLLPTTDPARPTELPAGNYDVAVFENRFPSLTDARREPAAIQAAAETAPAFGRCEVVVFSQDPSTSLGELPLDHIALILDVWAARTRRMAEMGIKYVLPFENRGREMGVTLHHPHGQIYGYGFIPALQARALIALRQYRRDHGRDLVSALAEGEAERGVRVVAQRAHGVAIVPPFARFPYEGWIIPFRRVPDLASFNPGEKGDIAALLKETLQRLDRLWGQPMPYLLSVHQAPTDGEQHEEWSVRIEIWPIRRAPEKLKYLAGTELAAGVFASDVLPEGAAAQLRAVRL